MVSHTRIIYLSCLKCAAFTLSNSERPRSAGCALACSCCRMPRKTALADEIAALLNPTPAEQDDDEFVSSSQKSLGLLGDDDVTVQKQSGRRMRAAIDMSSTGAKYAGRVTTRDALDRRHRLPSKPQRAEEEEEDGEEEDDGAVVRR